MSLGENLQYLRKMRGGMTQEELAEQLGVSRQTVSKWEVDTCYPEVDKIMELCKFFNCSMDKLVMEDINLNCDNYSNIRVEEMREMDYVQYSVISPEPEDDALAHIGKWAKDKDIKNPEIVGWDFPYVSQEQINVFHMHGYCAACILPEGMNIRVEDLEVLHQPKQKYAIITIKEPFLAPFSIIPKAYQALMSFMQVNAIRHKEDASIACFEKTYLVDDVEYMDVYIAADL